MSDAQTILKLIETVDPNDTAKLDEIDARVYSYLNKICFDKWFYEWCNSYWMRDNFGFDKARKKHLFKRFKYARSRDALKAIRPDGYFLICNDQNDPEQFRCEFLASYKTPTIYAYAPTEELAELHAIIQSIEYDRSQTGI